ncbi:LysE/ArgO family amino acid transporter [Latilactobacillus graminis]|uniref:LysE type translocator family protein n=2 Tax=Latilactobacillus graminis TaxID=60519 RepID=A0AA89KXU4_9LACO|nr:LysE family transporter [Latilactobacillus graminis]KRM23762.1 lysE type translocator family protein [Latilactobacillus graminis DSM 20719]QFP80146.1 amino acid transporter [Latilactobacillus graminis]
MFFLKGILIGFAFVAPIGMQNIFVFNNAMSNTTRRAVFNSLFIWVFDALFSLVAFYGIGALILQNDAIRLAIMGVGGILILWIGYTILKSARSTITFGALEPMALRKVILTAFVAVWGNPQALIDGTLMLGALRGGMSNSEAIPFIIGVVSASATWFFSIAIIFSLFRKKVSPKFLMGVNLVSAIIIIVYGLSLLLKVGTTLF